MIARCQCYLAMIVLSTVVMPAMLPHHAVSAEVPHTRTFSGLVSPAFPYARPETVGLSSEKLDWLGGEIKSWVASGDLVGAELLIVKRGKSIFHEAYGWSDREAGRPMRRNSIFAIKSMSKPITASAILMLADDGKLSLEDPVGRFVPNFPHDKVTIRHLLSHTSGITYDLDAYDFSSAEASLENLVVNWPHAPPGKPLGTYSYNDYNFAALAYIAGVASGKPVSEFIEERLLEPLGLENTTTTHLADRAWQSRLNPWYRWNSRAREYDHRRTSRAPDWPDFYPGGWGVFSTCMDYAAFMGMWVNGGQWSGNRLLSEARIREAMTPGLPPDYYGHGWMLDDYPRTEAISFWHAGGGDTVGIAFPADDAIVVYLTQSRWGSHFSSFSNRLYLSGLFDHPGLGFRFQNMVWADGATVAEVEPAPGKLARYVGTYDVEDPVDRDPEVFRIEEAEGRIVFRWGARGSAADNMLHLVALGDHRFALGRRQDGRTRAIDKRHSVRFVIDGESAGALELSENGDVLYSARRGR